MDIITWLLFGLVAMLTHIIEGVTGFGATVLGMPFAILLLGVEIAKPVLTLYALLLCLYIFIRNIHLVRWDSYLKMMGALLIGLPMGIAVYNYLPQNILLTILAVFMILVSIRGMLIAFDILQKTSQIAEWIALIFVWIGGVIHGAYSSGGPLIIIYATEKIKDKSEFRATLCLIWVTLNTIILSQMALAGQLTKQVWEVSLYGIPFLIGGTIVGNIAHHKLNESVFTKLTYTILLVTGIVMLV